jgi:hypothetical protein
MLPMKGGVSRPDRLVDVTRLPGLDLISDPGARSAVAAEHCTFAQVKASLRPMP